MLKLKIIEIVYILLFCAPILEILYFMHLQPILVPTSCISGPE